MAGLPAAAPSAAPAAAPTTVPITAPPTVLSVAVFCAVVPTCCEAHWRQTASSPWNCSKLLLLPGKTMTLGPCGTVAQPLEQRAGHHHRDAPARDAVHRGRSGTLTHSSGQLGTVG